MTLNNFSVLPKEQIISQAWGAKDHEAFPLQFSISVLLGIGEIVKQSKQQTEDEKTAMPREILHLWHGAEASAGSELSPDLASPKPCKEQC